MRVLGLGLHRAAGFRSRFRGLAMRMEDHFGPTVLAAIEMLVGIGRFFQAQFMGDEPRRIGAAGVD